MLASRSGLLAPPSFLPESISDTVTAFRVLDLKHFIKSRHAIGLRDYFDGLLNDEALKRISPAELRALFEVTFDADLNLNGLQWMLIYSDDVKSSDVIWMLLRMQAQGIYSSSEVLKLLTQVNSTGHSTSSHVWLRGSQHAVKGVAELIRQFFAIGVLSSAQFQEVLNPRDMRGRPLLLNLLYFASPQTLAQYFSEWQTSWVNPEACRCYAEALIQPYEVQINTQQIERRFPLHDILVSSRSTLETLDLYINQLQLCRQNQSLSASAFFRALTQVRIGGESVLRYLAFHRQDFLERYLKEMEICARLGLASLPDLLEVFRPLALNGKDSIHDPSELVFADKTVAACFGRIVRRCQKNPDLLVRTLPGWQNFAARMNASYGRELRFACSFGESPRKPSPSAKAVDAASKPDIVGEESKAQFKCG